MVFRFLTQAGPSENQNQIANLLNNEVHTLNASFPKIDNLEHFPLKVLINIFENCDDILLLNFRPSIAVVLIELQKWCLKNDMQPNIL